MSPSLGFCGGLPHPSPPALPGTAPVILMRHSEHMSSPSHPFPVRGCLRCAVKWVNLRPQDPHSKAWGGTLTMCSMLMTFCTVRRSEISVVSLVRNCPPLGRAEWLWLEWNMLFEAASSGGEGTGNAPGYTWPPGHSPPPTEPAHPARQEV